MKVWTLIENTTTSPDLICEHGLSLYIEAGEHRILFDAGQTGAFADNAEKMGVDLSRVDICVLSHGHYDHGGGLKRFLEVNDHAPIYVNRHAFGDYYNGEGKYIGLDWELLSEDRLVFTGDNRTIDDHVSIHSCPGFPQPSPVAPHGLTVLRGGQQVEDDFRHEQYLLIREGERRILLSGCSHRGILNIKTWFAPDAFLGGFHLMKLDPQEEEIRFKATAYALLAGQTVYYTGHCTGEAQYDALTPILGKRLNRLSTGAVFEV